MRVQVFAVARHRAAAPMAEPVAFAGPVTALWPAGATSVLAVETGFDGRQVCGISPYGVLAAISRYRLDGGLADGLRRNAPAVRRHVTRRTVRLPGDSADPRRLALASPT